MSIPMSSTAARLQALIFDVDGTLADTEDVHLAAFNHAFAMAGLDWTWDEKRYTTLLQISGGKERILHYWKQVNPDIKSIDGQGLQDKIAHIHDLKTAAYENAVSSGSVSLRPGILKVMDQALKAGMQLAIACTTSPVNIAGLLRHALGSDWRLNFSAIVDASIISLKKPHPLVYLKMLDTLQVPACNCLAFEDSSNGLHSARAAGLATIITPNRFTAQHDFTGALRVVPDLSQVTLLQMQQWLEQRASISCRPKLQ